MDLSKVDEIWKEQENIILGNVKNARANKAIEEHKLEALERDKKRKKESIKLKNQAVLDRIIEKNMMRRSYKDRMEAVAKKREMKKLERLKKEKKVKGRNLNSSMYRKQKNVPRKTQMKKKQFAQMTAGMDLHEEL